MMRAYAARIASCGIKTMDYPRFERIEGPQDRRHLSYHGGRLVELVLARADLIAKGRRRGKPRSAAPRRLMAILVAWEAARQPSNS
jgi:hypothetical protein